MGKENMNERCEEILKNHGWEYYPGDDYTEDVWLLPNHVLFEGSDSLARAIAWQFERWAEMEIWKVNARQEPLS